jgi:hypothetical protein
MRVGGKQIIDRGNAHMRTNLTLIASAVFFAVTFGVAHAADNQPTGAAVGTPGAESKGTPIPVPDQAPGTTVDKGGNPSASTPAEESKGKPTIPE